MTELSDQLLVQIAEDARNMVSQGGKILSQYQDKFTVVKKKDDIDLATTADIASEKFIIDNIREKYPDHDIYSEEAGDMHKTSDFTWIIDPLDGTKEYSRGLREYSCLVAVEYRGELIAGAMQRNGVNDLYMAARGQGAECNGRDIRVSVQDLLEDAFVGFHVPTRTHPEEKIVSEMEVLNKLVRSCYRVRPGWEDAKCAAWVARGVLDAHVISADVNQWYDISSGVILVQEAGGIVSDWQGNPIINRDESKGLILSNKNIHRKLIELINS